MPAASNTTGVALERAPADRNRTRSSRNEQADQPLHPSRSIVMVLKSRGWCGSNCREAEEEWAVVASLPQAVGARPADVGGGHATTPTASREEAEEPRSSRPGWIRSPWIIDQVVSAVVQVAMHSWKLEADASRTRARQLALTRSADRSCKWASTADGLRKCGSIPSSLSFELLKGGVVAQFGLHDAPPVAASASN